MEYWYQDARQYSITTEISLYLYWIDITVSILQKYRSIVVLLMLIVSIETSMIYFEDATTRAHAQKYRARMYITDIHIIHVYFEVAYYV